MNQKLLEFREINLISKPIDEVLGFHNCCFCGKTVEDNSFAEANKKLSGDAFYCNYCLKMGFNTKNNRNCLVISFRAIIGYYYHSFYLGKIRKLWLNDIKDMIEQHESVGNLYPFMSYDPETMFWFIDFKKIGKGQKQIPLEEVKKALVNILVCFNLQQNIPKFHSDKFAKKMFEAVDEFYKHRRKTEGKIAILSLFGFGELDRNVNTESLKSFAFKNLQQIS